MNLETPRSYASLDYTPAVRSLMADYMIARLWSGGAAIGLEIHRSGGQLRKPSAALAVRATAEELLARRWIIPAPRVDRDVHRRARPSRRCFRCILVRESAQAVHARPAPKSGAYNQP